MSHKDKRSVHTDALETLGTIIGDDEHRDAIHLAVEPVEAGEWLVPGQDISLVNGKAFNRTGKHVGIVDPFLKEPIAPGQKFWLVVYPRMITSLRHVWTHPSFADVPEVAVAQAPFAQPAEEGAAPPKRTRTRKKSNHAVAHEQLIQARLLQEERDAETAAEAERVYKRGQAEQWLRDYADTVDADFDEMMSVADSHHSPDGWGDYLSDGVKWEGESVPEEFWEHYAIYKDVEYRHAGNFFSCSC